jgi:2-methylcitrate dehydratase PrpD
MLERADRPAVETGREAKVSIQHSVAVAFLDGAAGLAQYADRRVADPAVRALRARVAVEEDPDVPVEAAIVTVRLTDGSSFSEHIRDGRGTPGRLMSDDELDGKVRELAAFGAPFVDMPALIAAIRGIEQENDVGRIVGLAVPAPH